MSYFRIVLPELANICQSLGEDPDEGSLLLEDFSYRNHFETFGKLHIRIEANWRLIQNDSEKSSKSSSSSSKRYVEGSSSSSKRYVEGHGQIDLLQDEKLLTYKGEWINGNLKVYYFKSDLSLFIGGLFFFRGVEYKLKDFQQEEIRTHLSFETNALGSIERYLLFAPILHGAPFYLESNSADSPFPKIFYLEINDRKLEEQFLLSPQFPINAIIEKVISWDKQNLVDIQITIRKDWVIVSRESREGKQFFRRQEEKRLPNGPIPFFESRLRPPNVIAG